MKVLAAGLLAFFMLTAFTNEAAETVLGGTWQGSKHEFKPAQYKVTITPSAQYLVYVEPERVARGEYRIGTTQDRSVILKVAGNRLDLEGSPSMLEDPLI